MRKKENRATEDEMVGWHHRLDGKLRSSPGSSDHGRLQTRILEWVAISFSRVSSQTRGQIHISCIDSLPLNHLGSPCKSHKFIKILFKIFFLQDPFSCSSCFTPALSLLISLSIIPYLLFSPSYLLLSLANHSFLPLCLKVLSTCTLWLGQSKTRPASPSL